MSKYYKATEVDEFLNIFGKENCNLCAFYDEYNPIGLDGEGLHQYCWQAKRFPTADVVPVVRCKDCKYYTMNTELLGNVCKRLFTVFSMKPDDFCSYGEGKNEE